MIRLLRRTYTTPSTTARTAMPTARYVVAVASLLVIFCFFYFASENTSQNYLTLLILHPHVAARPQACQTRAPPWSSATSQKKKEQLLQWHPTANEVEIATKAIVEARRVPEVQRSSLVATVAKKVRVAIC